MKLLYCYRHGVLGGVVTQLVNRLRGLQSAEDPPSHHLLFARDHGVSGLLENLAPVTFEDRAAAVRDFAAAERFDAIVVVDTPEFLEAMEGLPGRLIIEVHTTYERGLRYLSDRRWRPDGFIVPSGYSGAMLEGLGYGGSEPIHVVPNSLDPALFPVVRVPAVPSRPVLLWVGKLDGHKNWRGFLEVVAEVRSRGIDAEGWLVGGETASRTAEEDLLEAIADRELTPAVRWMPRIEYRRMHRLYGTVRDSGGAVVVTSKAESFGMVVLEALMCGCPVVASRVGAIPEVCEDRRILALYEYGAYPEAGAAVCSMITGDHEGLVGQVLEERPALCERYSLASVASRYHGLVRDIVRRDETTVASTPGHSTAYDELRAEVDRVRKRLPNRDEHPGDPVAYLRSTQRVLDLRSYRLAAVVASRRGGVASWIRVARTALRVLTGRTPSPPHEPPGGRL